MKQYILLIVIFFSLSSKLSAKDYTLLSPDKKIKVVLNTNNFTNFSLIYNDLVLVKKSNIGIQVDGIKYGFKPKVINSRTRSQNKIIIPIVREKNKEIIDKYNELEMDFSKGFSIILRAYNNGFAYRFKLNKSQKIINGEIADYKFPNNYMVYWPKERKFHSNNQVYYSYISLAQLNKRDLGSLPILMNTLHGVKIIIAESALNEYPGMWFNGGEGNSLKATFVHYPKRVEQTSDRDVIVRETYNYIAKTKGERVLPWRIIGVAEKDGDLIENQLTYILAEDCKIKDTKWIKPGKVSWDWWNANNIYGVDFKSGINNETYKYYIDFASKYGLEYIMLDEGWYKLGNLLDVVPEINIKELVDYGKKKNVGVLLWVVWKTLDDQMDIALDKFKEWGVKGNGVKLSFKRLAYTRLQVLFLLL